MHTTKRIALILALALLSGCPGNVANGVTVGAVTLNPTSAALSCGTTTATFTASQVNFSGPFTAVSADTTQDTVAAGPGTNQFTVTDANVGSSGSVSITVTGAGGQTAVFTANNTACVCMRHHDTWNGHSKR